MSHQHWNILIKFNISPNQIYLLNCYRDKIKPAKIINEEGEKMICQAKDLLDGNNNLTNKAIIILNEYETFFVKTKRKVAVEILGENFNERLKEYREIWPSKRLPSGELARQSTQEIKDKFIWFFKTYPEFDWDIILDATEYYNEVFKRKNYMYMVTSSYFIKKTNTTTKEITSKLADYCQEILDNPKLLNGI